MLHQEGFFFFFHKLKHLSCNLSHNMDVLTAIKDSDLSFGFGTWEKIEVVTEATVLLDSWKLSVSAQSNVALTPQVMFSEERTESSF